MPKAQTKRPPKIEYKGFHNINLSKSDEQAFEEWRKENTTGMAWIEVLSNDGYKVSFNFDDYNSGIKASLYCNSAKSDWAGYTLTAWAGDLQTAFDLLCFKHYVMANQKWEVAQDKPNRQHASYG